MLRACLTVAARGFSQSTCLPAFAACNRVLLVLARRGRDVDSFNLGFFRQFGILAVGVGVAGFELLREFVGFALCRR